MTVFDTYKEYKASSFGLKGLSPLYDMQTEKEQQYIAACIYDTVSYNLDGTGLYDFTFEGWIEADVYYWELLEWRETRTPKLVYLHANHPHYAPTFQSFAKILELDVQKNFERFQWVQLRTRSDAAKELLTALIERTEFDK